MISSVLYTSPETSLVNKTINQIIYTNSYNKDINLQYCMLRSDLVILTEVNKKLEEWCSWYMIPFQKVLTEVPASLFNNVNRVTLIESSNRDALNSIFKLLKTIPSSQNLTVFANCVENPGIKMATALGGK